MGLSSKSKRLQRNRANRRVSYYPKELKRLKATLKFKWDDKQRSAHLSMFHDLMNGPLPSVPGCEEGSGIERLHLTQTNVSAERNERLLKKRMETAVTSAVRALDKTVRKKTDESEKTTEPEEKKIYDEKTMKDQFGRYAPWLGQKAIQKLIEEKREEKRKQKAKQRIVERRESMRKKKKRRSTTSAVTDVEMEELKDEKA